MDTICTNTTILDSLHVIVDINNKKYEEGFPFIFYLLSYLCKLNLLLQIQDHVFLVKFIVLVVNDFRLLILEIC